MNWKVTLFNIMTVLMLVTALIFLSIALSKKPEITVQPEEPTREYIQKYPVAGGGYQYILVREYELSVEFVDDTTYGGIDKEEQ
jgi:hypothetical protein